MQQVLGDVKVLIPTISSYGENIEDVLSRMINNKTKKIQSLYSKLEKNIQVLIILTLNTTVLFLEHQVLVKAIHLIKDKEDLIKKMKTMSELLFILIIPMQILLELINL